MATTIANWAELPLLPLSIVADKLNSPPDYVRFRSVCSTWRSAAPRRRYLPLLLLHHRDGVSPSLRTIFSFASLSPTAEGGEVTSLPLPPAVLGLPCCGCSHGWLALLHPTPMVSLFNPLTNDRIPLPRYSRFPDFVFPPYSPPIAYTKLNDAGDFLCTDKSSGKATVLSFDRVLNCLSSKVILSSDPSAGPARRCIALAIRCRWTQVEFCRLGDDEWTPIKCPEEFRTFHVDAQFYKGRFFVASRLNIYTCKLSYGDAGLIEVPHINPPGNVVSVLPEIDESYLVESAGDLLLVTLYYREFFEGVNHYAAKVYKLVWMRNKVMLMNLDELGGRSLFVGRNRCFSLRVSDYPGLLGDAIYMAEYYKDEKKRIRVIRMPKCANTFLPLNLSVPKSDWTPCAWFNPSLL